MKNKLKYFGIFENCYKFKELSEQDQKKFLIENNVYVKGKSKDIYEEALVNWGYINNSQHILYLGKDFVFAKTNYTLNPDFIDEVYKTISNAFENGRLKNIIEHIKVLTLSFQTLDTEDEKANFINSKKEIAKEEYRKNFTDKIFQDFHSQKEIDTNFKEIVFRKYLTYDIKHLSDYIFGMANFPNFFVVQSYSKFIRLNEILTFCDKHSFEIEKIEFEKIDFAKPSVPKSIAMLKAAGFFELESIKKLPPKKLYQIIAIILGKDPNNKTDNRSIRGNYNVLNKNSEENPANFTTNSHIKSMKNLLK